jgi:ribonuclease HII
MIQLLCCGLDEAGRGPVIGPMVMALVCSDQETMSFTGARDSKILSPSNRERIFSVIMKEARGVSYKIISSTTINEMMEHMTLNSIEEEYAKMLIRESPYEHIYVDAFDVNEERLSRKLSESTGKKVICKHKGDSLYPVVSAASIIAKVTRDSEIEKLKKIYGDFGSGYPSDPKTINFLRASIESNVDISNIVRTGWSTYRNILSQVNQRRF